jgi:hypothetical protein
MTTFKETTVFRFERVKCKICGEEVFSISQLWQRHFETPTHKRIIEEAFTEPLVEHNPSKTMQK